MAAEMPVDPKMTIDALMRQWPAAIRIVLEHRMLCVGCPVGIFHTIEEACAAHSVDRDRFAAALRAAIGGE